MAMRDMSRAIRQELQEYGTTLQDIPEAVLIDYAEIVGAFFYDLVGEKERRGLVAQRPSTVVAQEIKLLRASLDAHHVELDVTREDCPICAAMGHA